MAWPWLVGSVLRLWELPRQILVDDEWHMLHKLRGGGALAGIVREFGEHDHSIGLSLCAWLLMRITALDETLVRMPAVIAGLALLVLAPRLVARHVDRRSAIVLAWLLAVSPLLCFFSRLARPYAVTTLLTTLATFGAYAWTRHAGRSRRAEWTYVASAGAVGLFHLPALPAALAPLLFAAGVALRPARGPSPSRPDVLRLAGCTSGAVAAALALPLARGTGQIADRLAADRMSLATLRGGVELLAGTPHWLVIALLAVLGAVGARTLRRRAPQLTGCLLIVIAVQTLAIAASGAAAVHVPIVAARYVAATLPLLLVFPAAGLAATTGRVPSTLVGLGCAVALGVAGPLPWIYRAPNDFTNHVSYQADYRPHRYSDRFRPATVSPFYTDVLRALPPDSVAIVEAPWHYYFHPLAHLQRIHRQRVLIGFVTRGVEAPRIGEIGPGDAGIRLANAAFLVDPDDLVRRGVRFVVLHRDPRTELRWPSGVSEVGVDTSHWIAFYRDRFGPPVHEDAQLVAFRLPAARTDSAHAAAASAPPPAIPGRSGPGRSPAGRSRPPAARSPSRSPRSRGGRRSGRPPRRPGSRTRRSG